MAIINGADPSSNASGNPKPVSRRDALRFGAIGLGALAVAPRLKASLAAPRTLSERAPLLLPSKDPVASIAVDSVFDPTEPYVQALLRAFAKSHPSIKVNWRIVPASTPQQDQSIEITRVADKNGVPDIIVVNGPNMEQFAAEGYLADITQGIKPYVGVLPPAMLDEVSFNGRIWGLPLSNSDNLVFYNKAYLTKADITLPTVNPRTPMTWQQLQADALKAKAAGAKYGMIMSQPNQYYLLQPLPMSIGGSNGVKGKDGLTLDITSKQWITAFNWYHDLYVSGAAPRGIINYDDTLATFLAGQTAYYVGLDSQILQLAKFDVGVSPMPKFAGGKQISPNGSWAYGINPFSHQQEAALIFLKYFTLDYFVNDGQLPQTTHFVQEYFNTAPFDTGVGKDFRTIVEYQSQYTSVVRAPSVGFNEFDTFLTSAFDDIVDGTPATTALNTASAQINSAWAALK